jgi:hypothetical protein
MLSGKLGVFVLVQFLELRFRFGERTRLACCRWRLANDFSMFNQKYFGEAPKSAREARVLPGKDASLRAANVKAERSASAKIYLFAPITELRRRLSLTRYEIARNAGNSICCF